jgi:hypothetical protein
VPSLKSLNNFSLSKHSEKTVFSFPEFSCANQIGNKSPASLWISIKWLFSKREKKTSALEDME